MFNEFPSIDSQSISHPFFPNSHSHIPNAPTRMVLIGILKIDLPITPRNNFSCSTYHKGCVKIGDFLLFS